MPTTQQKTTQSEDSGTISTAQIKELWSVAKSNGFTTPGIYELLYDFGEYAEADEVPKEEFDDLLEVARTDGIASYFNEATYDGLNH